MAAEQLQESIFFLLYWEPSASQKGCSSTRLCPGGSLGHTGLGNVPVLVSLEL